MTLPEKMTAVEISSPGGPEMLVPTDRPIPSPGADDVLIEVRAAGVNRPDAIQRAGHYPAPPGASDLPGLEVAGAVAALGENVSGWKIGDDVCALTPGGGYAGYCLAPAGHCLPIPAGFSMVEAASLPETFFTVWHNVFQRGALKSGETFLVHGGSSGIGATAIQLAKAFGAQVITTAGSDEKRQFCDSLGADKSINYRTEDWPALVREFTKKRGVDVILEMVGGRYLQQDINSLAMDGRVVIIGFLGGSKAEIDFTRVMVRRQTITGSTLRPQSDAVKTKIADALLQEVWPLLENGTVKPVIHKVFPLAAAADAHTLMESSQHMGKIMLSLS
ncbi:MAG: putative PIG3 family NAD(P)H quinone oxidoreductase [Alphaproteobacteria bacterium]|jgi:NADPH2:quinone reductase